MLQLRDKSGNFTLKVADNECQANICMAAANWSCAWFLGVLASGIGQACGAGVPVSDRFTTAAKAACWPQTTGVT